MWRQVAVVEVAPEVVETNVVVVIAAAKVVDTNVAVDIVKTKGSSNSRIVSNKKCSNVVVVNSNAK